MYRERPDHLPDSSKIKPSLCVVVRTFDLLIIITGVWTKTCRPLRPTGLLISPGLRGGYSYSGIVRLGPRPCLQMWQVLKSAKLG
jgi:hypothetical protein